MKEIGIGVVGLGRLGYAHARNVRGISGARLVAVCDMQEELAGQTAAELGCKSYTDVRRMLEDREIDAVCVATPTALHVDPLTAAAEAGKPAFCEKPLAGTLEDSLKLRDVVKAAGITCQLGFQRRFDPAHAAAEQAIREGRIGRPVYISAFARDPFPPPPWAMDPSRGGGLYIDFLLHDFDMARFLLKDEVDTVYADETNLVVDGEGIERFADNAIVTVRFKGGALATYHCGMHAGYGYDIRTEVHGATGNLIIGGLNKVDMTVCTLEGGISKPITYQKDDKLPHFVVRFMDAYRLEMEAFVRCVLDGTPPPVTVDDSIRAFIVAMAAGESAGKHQPVRMADYEARIAG